MLYTVNFFLTDCETAIHCTQLAERMRRVVKKGGEESIKNARLTLYETFEDLRVHISARDFVHDHGGHWEAFFERHPGLKNPIAAFVKAVGGFDKAIVGCDPATMTTESEWLETAKLREASEGLRAAIEGKPAAPAPRVVVHRKPPTVTLDNIHYPLTEAQAVFVDILVQNLDHLVQPATFDREPILDSVRRPRLKKKLPEPIRDLIQGFPGGGYKMTLP